MATHHPLYCILTVGALFLCEACTIKEDRSDCPCYLEIDVSDCYRVADEVQLRWRPERGGVSTDKLPLGPWREVFGKEVPRGYVSYSAYSGAALREVSSESLIIPYGHASDSLYAYSATLEAVEETMFDIVVMHKQFATLNIGFCFGSGIEAPDAKISLTGDWNGLRLDSLSPVQGSFACMAGRCGGNLWAATVPRQGDDSLTMHIETPSGSDSLPVGEYLRLAGYDWTETDLKDVRIDIDWQQWSISIDIEPWSEGRTYNINI